jgi:hypothetical protein
MKTQKLIGLYNGLVLDKFRISRRTKQAKALEQSKRAIKQALNTHLEIPATVTKSGQVETIQLYFWKRSVNTGLLALRPIL